MLNQSFAYVLIDGWVLEGRETRDWQPIQDPVLGHLVWDNDLDWWESEIELYLEAGLAYPCRWRMRILNYPAIASVVPKSGDRFTCASKSNNSR
jgi:hypothetical protein